MFRKPRARGLHASRLATASLPLFLLLAACGGGSIELANIPPQPPTPKPTPTPMPTVTSINVETSWIASPAAKSGTYDLLALTSESTVGGPTSQQRRDGEFKLEVSKAGSGFGYDLQAPSGFLSGSLTNTQLPVQSVSWDFNAGGPNYRYDNPYGDYPQLFGQNLTETEVYSDGSQVIREDYDFNRAVVSGAIIDLPNDTRVSENMTFDAGLSYVAMGAWPWGTVALNSDGSATPGDIKNTIYFAYGDRTPGSAIPASGTASYSARALGHASEAGIPFTLLANFGQRSIATQIDQGSLFDVSGSASFNNAGNFEIPLSGSAGSNAASGELSGAFFGPQAEQVGGVFSVQSQGSVLIQDAFVGEHHQP
jgi:hypothetical protein